MAEKKHRSKRQSDELYNIRRKAKRLGARIANESKKASTPETRARLQQLNKQLGESIAKTYVRSAGSVSKAFTNAVAMEARSSGAYREHTRSQARRREERAMSDERANRVFASERNRAMSGDPETVFGEYGEADVRIFYTATKDLWQGHRLAERDATIMEALGVTNLFDAFDVVMELNSTARQAAHDYLDSLYYGTWADQRTDEELDFLEGSPPSEGNYVYLSLVNYLSPYAFAAGF